MVLQIDWEAQLGRRLKLRELDVFVSVVKRGSGLPPRCDTGT
jgi:hypothetical protein